MSSGRTLSVMCDENYPTMDRPHDSGYDEESSQDTIDDVTSLLNDAKVCSIDVTKSPGCIMKSSNDVTSWYREVDVPTNCDKLSTFNIRHRRTSTSSLASSYTSSSSDYRHNIGSWRSLTAGGLQIKESQLLWNNKNHKHIWDMTFLQDGTLAVIAGRSVKMESKVVTLEQKHIVCLDREGRDVEQPFPGTYRDPGGVSVCRSTGTIAVTDTRQEHGVVTILRRVAGHWVYKTHQTDQAASRVALTETDTAVCAVRWEKLVKYRKNEKVWSRSIASTNDLVPYIHIGRHRRIIVSTPVTNRISVFSSDGQLLVVFPSWFIKKPAGVCTDSTGRVIVADSANHRIAQFTVQGHFIQTLVYTEHQPTCIALYDDKYLAVGSHFDGLFLYELDWQ